MTPIQDSAMKMLFDVRASLVARAMGEVAGGDIVIMQAVDRIVDREVAKRLEAMMKPPIVFEGLSMSVEAVLPQKWETSL